MVCRQVGLDHSDLEDMTIGMCMDFIDEYLDMHDPKRKKNRVRKANQADMDRF